MEFLNIILTKDSSLLLVTVHSTSGFEKTKLYSGFKNPHRKFAEQENMSLFMTSILWHEKLRVENLDQKCRSRIPFQVIIESVIRIHILFWAES
jgi:hypothetical protein